MTERLSDPDRVFDSNEILEVSILSVIGDREEQQDSFGYELGHTKGLIAVCDGMGGHLGGSLASNRAIETILTEYKNSFSNDNIVGNLQAIIKRANEAVLKLTDSNGNSLRAGSTAVCVYITGTKLYWNSVGDSRAYLFRNGEYVQITQDHNYRTVLKEQLNAGVIDRNIYDAEKVRGEALISYLGIGDLGLIDYNDSPVELQQDDRILLMSDGLYKIVNDQDICSIINNFNNIEEAIQALELKAKKHRNKKRDNMTVALIRIK
ncbi:MAG: serine/threonine-protein phosphatase [Clostridia bacterium]|nr:serine/threonine-protein phosphatase [Clostridia bacterium]